LAENIIKLNINSQLNRLQLQKLRCELAEASKPNPILDAKA